MKTMLRNNQGMLDDVFDYLFLVLVGMFLLFFLGNYLQAPIESGKEVSVRNVAQFHHTESALQNLRVQVSSGFHLDPKSVGQKIQSSKVLAGRSITSCTDYNSPTDCGSDAVGISSTGCTWNSGASSCHIAFKEPTGIGRLPGGARS